MRVSLTVTAFFTSCLAFEAGATSRHNLRGLAITRSNATSASASDTGIYPQADQGSDTVGNNSTEVQQADEKPRDHKKGHHHLHHHHGHAGHDMQATQLMDKQSLEGNGVLHGQMDGYGQHGDLNWSGNGNKQAVSSAGGQTDGGGDKQSLEGNGVLHGQMDGYGQHGDLNWSGNGNK